MKAFGPILTVIVLLAGPLHGQNPSRRAWEMERKGDAAGARELLQRASQEAPRDIQVQVAYAEFLDRHGDPGARSAYKAALDLPGADRKSIARRLAVLDLLAGDRAAASGNLEIYRSAGGADLSLPSEGRGVQVKTGVIHIPGPLPSFARMAALSPDLPREELLPALARNIVTNGYQATNSTEGLDQTEYLKLVVRYLSQARELEKLAGPEKEIRIETCESAQTADLLRVLGYRMRGGCGSDVVLETVNATRAFLTIDSGFPLAELEQSLRTNRPFRHDYQPSEAPVLYGPEYWLTGKEKQGDFIDHFIADPAMCRLYLGMSKLDSHTAEELRKQLPVQRLKATAHVLDFFGSMFEIRNGKAVTPGGARAARGWEDLAGANPDNGPAFLEKLLTKDDGWLASYFDSLSRIVNDPIRDYLTEPERLKRYYAAIRGKVTSPGPARPVFRSNTDLMLLTTRLRLDSNGRPHVPGGVEVWKNLFINHPHGKYDGKLTKSAAGWKDADDVLEALFALCRKAVENEPLKIFMAISDLERHRPRPFEPATVDRMAREYRSFGSQYSIFGETPAISDSTVLLFLETAAAVSKGRDPLLRSDKAGTLQALVALWQIFSRQGVLPASEADSTLVALLKPFSTAKEYRDIFDAAKSGVRTLLAATKSPGNVSVHDRMLDLIAGVTPAESDTHGQVIQDMIRIFEAQRLISLQLIFDLADNLEKVTQGQKIDSALVGRLASRISEIQLPRASMSTAEKNSLAFGYWSEKHIDNQRKINLRAAVEKAGQDPEKLANIRGLLAPILRDTLVGYAYIHYAPPGAQILHTNPVFVRSHDFIGLQGANQTWKNTEVFGTGWPANAGGRLVGSLSGLPYALAEAEQNFLIPSREQALIWGDLAPQMLVSATVPRWWNVTSTQLHWVGAHMRFGESLVAQSSLGAQAKSTVMSVLETQGAPGRVRRVEKLIEAGAVREAIENIMPSELFLIAAAALKGGSEEPLAAELKAMAGESPQELSYAAISRAFGTPKPTLTNTYVPELLNLRTFPTLMGYSSRMLAESWESNLLYYAALADELHVSPDQLNVLIPSWTQQTLERVFATHLEDWPALLRSLRMVGDDVRSKTRRQMLGAAAGGE